MELRFSLSHWPLPNTVSNACIISSRDPAWKLLSKLLTCKACWDMRWIARETIALYPLRFQRRTCKGDKYHIMLLTIMASEK